MKKTGVLPEGKYLELFCGGEDLPLDSSGDCEHFAGAHNVFPGLSDYFGRWIGLQTNRIPTPQQSVDVYKIMRSGTCVEILSSLERNFSEMFLTQSQIIQFCKKYPNFLGTVDHPTYFPFKVISLGNPRLYVATVYYIGDCLHADLGLLWRNVTCCSRSMCYLVVRRT